MAFNSEIKPLSPKKHKEYYDMFVDAINDNNSRPFGQHFGIYQDYYFYKHHNEFLKKACNVNNPEVLLTLLSVDLRHYQVVLCFQELSTTKNVECLEALINLIKPEGKAFTKTFINDFLFASIEQGNLFMVQWALDHGAKIYEKQFDFQALDYAAQYGRKDIFDLILSKGAKLHHNKDDALFKAYRHEHFDLFFHILSIDPSIHKELNNIIFMDLDFESNQKGKEKIYEDVFIKLIPFMANDKIKSIALTSSIRFQFYDAVDVMLENNFNVHQKDIFAWVFHHDDEKMAKLLMDYGANPDLLTPKEKVQLTYNMEELFKVYPRMVKIKERLEKKLDNSNVITKQHKI